RARGSSCSGALRARVRAEVDELDLDLAGRVVHAHGGDELLERPGRQRTCGARVLAVLVARRAPIEAIGLAVLRGRPGADGMAAAGAAQEPAQHVVGVEAGEA